MTNGDGLFFKGNGMEEENYRDFITGLGEEIRASDMTQTDLAKKSRVSYTNLSKVLNFKSGCSPKWRRNVCAALGTTEAAVIARGRREVIAPPAHTPVREEATLNPGQILSGVASIIEDLRAEKEKLRFWSDVFEYLPCSVTLLRGDGVVLFQNQESRRICPASVGENLCQTCREVDQSAAICSICPVEKTQESGGKAKFHKEIRGKNYIISTSFIKINHVEYQVILTTQIDRCQEWEKKEGANHGQEEQGE